MYTIDVAYDKAAVTRQGPARLLHTKVRKNSEEPEIGFTVLKYA